MAEDKNAVAYGVEIPLYVWMALNALGLGFLRAGMKKG